MPRLISQNLGAPQQQQQIRLVPQHGAGRNWPLGQQVRTAAFGHASTPARQARLGKVFGRLSMSRSKGHINEWSDLAY